MKKKNSARKGKGLKTESRMSERSREEDRQEDNTEGNTVLAQEVEQTLFLLADAIRPLLSQYNHFKSIL